MVQTSTAASSMAIPFRERSARKLALKLINKVGPTVLEYSLPSRQFFRRRDFDDIELEARGDGDPTNMGQPSDNKPSHPKRELEEGRLQNIA